MTNKWYTTTIYVDAETGEIIDEKTYKEEYYTILTPKPKIYVIKTTGYKKYTKVGRRHNQGKLFT